ncbi:hypothetical protein [Roseovarius sp.]|uniref:hypothetical protein n=1 Tax=Roseovarius sp. TaxID=1486281 RepID=UPI003BA9A447
MFFVKVCHSHGGGLSNPLHPTPANAKYQPTKCANITLALPPRSAYTPCMSWKDYLRPGEQAELQRAIEARDAIRAVYNATVAKLKSRAEARMRRGEEPDKEADQ